MMQLRPSAAKYINIKEKEKKKKKDELKSRDSLKH